MKRLKITTTIQVYNDDMYIYIFKPKSNPTLKIVGKRFLRSISSLKKSHNLVDSSSQSKIKYDEEPIKKTKSSIRILFGSSRRPSIPKDKHVMDLFDQPPPEVIVFLCYACIPKYVYLFLVFYIFKVVVDHVNKRASVQTLISPFAKNITIRTSTSDEFEHSDSGCFTTPITSDIADTMLSTQQTNLTSIQTEHAEPVFIKEKNCLLKHNRSESDLRLINSILKPWGARELRRRPSQFSLVNNLYDINNEDEEILKVKEKGKEGSILHISEDGTDVLVMEMVQSNKLQVLAGTLERLFMKLADETCQDLDYVDTYILSHLFFTDSFELLENLMARFHLEALPGETNYFKKWQRCIQVK